jgi:hypothetical protein
VADYPSTKSSGPAVPGVLFIFMSQPYKKDLNESKLALKCQKLKQITIITVHIRGKNKIDFCFGGV